jgi:hypothetical protein
MQHPQSDGTTARHFGEIRLNRWFWRPVPVLKIETELDEVVEDFWGELLLLPLVCQ